MRLYRHSTMCGTAVQMFLECNPQYWCCVPMKDVDAKNDNLVYTDDSIAPRLSTIAERVRCDEEAQLCVDNLPVPPLGYRFSRRQRDEQYLFFKNKQDLTKPSSDLDLYNATIVFVRMY